MLQVLNSAAAQTYSSEPPDKRPSFIESAGEDFRAEADEYRELDDEALEWSDGSSVRSTKAVLRVSAVVASQHTLRVSGFTQLACASSMRSELHNEGRTGMASSGKKKTTMAKLTRESRLRERRLDKQAKKDARKQASAHHPGRPSDTPPAATGEST